MEDGIARILTMMMVIFVSIKKLFVRFDGVNSLQRYSSHQTCLFSVKIGQKLTSFSLLFVMMIQREKQEVAVDDDDNHDNTKPHSFILMARETLDNNLLITYVVYNRNHAAASINKK